ncbi:hypothetical protein BD413DRAFT_474132 [Trametes elegans]|nr:hypothetical protein BD413DRAFT_474132 [Trametes elegans]
MIFAVVNGVDITNEQLQACATLFSNNYGIWAADVSPPLKPGARVRMSATKLRKECLGNSEASLVVLCYLQDELGKNELIGHAFVTKWPYQQGYVGWVTQLVVNIKQRRRFIATSMLQQLRRQTWFNDVTAMGIVSSHPAACNALCKLLNGNTRDVNLAYIRKHASAVLKCSTVQYLKEAQLRGAFLGEEGSLFSAFTAFFVDHHEPLQVLQTYMSRDRWSFGDLLDGHEFLVLVPVPVPPTSDINF